MKISSTSALVLSFLSTVSLAAAQTVTPEVELPTTSSSSMGVITITGTPFLHSYGSANTFLGSNSGNFTLTGSDLSAVGNSALGADTSGSQNEASGALALSANTMGSGNAANGYSALTKNTTGTGNTASGALALQGVTTGSYNTGVGYHTGGGGTGNTDMGAYAQTVGGGSDNTVIGYEAMEHNETGSNNIVIGYGAFETPSTGSNNICIGNADSSGGSNDIHIGTEGLQKKAVIAGIYDGTVASGVQVYVTSGGQLGVLTSSAKFKKNIRDMGSVSDKLMALRPVTFQYKDAIDPAGTPQFGLVAEEVDKVDPDLVARDENHDIYTVRYEAVNALMLNEVQKEHRHAAAQDETIAAQQKIIARQEEALTEQAAHAKQQDEQLHALAARVAQIDGSRDAR